MTIRHRLSCFGLLLAALLAVTSVTSVVLMTPDRAKLALAVLEQIQGTLDIGLCGDSTDAEHRCPLCHGLEKPPAYGHAEIVLRIVPYDGWRRGRDLHRAAQTRNLNHSPRGPPIAS